MHNFFYLIFRYVRCYQIFYRFPEVTENADINDKVEDDNDGLLDDAVHENQNVPSLR